MELPVNPVIFRFDRRDTRRRRFLVTLSEAPAWSRKKEVMVPVAGAQKVLAAEGSRPYTLSERQLNSGSDPSDPDFVKQRICVESDSVRNLFTKGDRPMENHDPLTLTSAEAFWDSVAPKLHARTIYQIVQMRWLTEEARSGIIQDGAVIDNIVDRLKEQFLEATRRNRIWSDAVDRWFARTHRRTTRKAAIREARKYFPTVYGRKDGLADQFEIPGHWDSPERSAERHEILERIALHCSKLPPARARIFQDLVDGLTAEEISARDGTRPGTIRKRIHDLRRELRRLIANERRHPCLRNSSTSIGSDETQRHQTILGRLGAVSPLP